MAKVQHSTAYPQHLDKEAEKLIFEPCAAEIPFFLLSSFPAEVLLLAGVEPLHK